VTRWPVLLAFEPCQLCPTRNAIVPILPAHVLADQLIAGTIYQAGEGGRLDGQRAEDLLPFGGLGRAASAT